MEIDYIQPIVVSAVVLILFFIFYLYKNENKVIMSILSSQYNKVEPVKLEKDTRAQDWIFLILVVALVFILGMKFVTLEVVISDSMRPEFQRGDMILTQSFIKEPNIGDIISFNTEESQYTITHRVVSVEEIIKTKGDNNPYIDDYKTTQKKITSKVIMIDDHPIVIKELGALFIMDYSRMGVISKYGDTFTFMQNLSATIRAWGYILTIISVLAYIMSIKR